LRGFFISKRPKLASGRGEMEKPLRSDCCAGLVGSEFGAGGIFAEGKNPFKRKFEGIFLCPKFDICPQCSF